MKIGDTYYAQEIYGATIAAPIWKQIMDRASTGMPFRDFAEPGGTVQFGDIVSIPRVYGLAVADALAALTGAGFQPVVGVAVGSPIQAGLVVGTQPASRALRGSTVTIFTSTGVAAPPPTTAPGAPKKHGH
jgi:hypothetical protein